MVDSAQWVLESVAIRLAAMTPDVQIATPVVVPMLAAAGATIQVARPWAVVCFPSFQAATRVVAEVARDAADLLASAVADIKGLAD